MKSFDLHKLNAAVESIAADVSARVRANARVCTEMRAPCENEGMKPPKKNRELAPRQLLAAQLLVFGRSIAAAARQLGVNECTIRRWKTDPRFVAEIQRLIAEAQKSCWQTSTRQPMSGTQMHGFARKRTLIDSNYTQRAQNVPDSQTAAGLWKHSIQNAPSIR